MKIALFTPYFGPQGATLPNYYEYWQKSAAANQKIDFYIPTNLEVDGYKKYDNIHYIKMTAEEFWEKIQEILNFPISCDYYKTGEYRMFFGIIFKDLLKDYDYWGMTEFDMIYGDILSFIGQYLEDGADVIGETAPFRIIKNTDRLNHMPFADLKDFKYPLTLDRALGSKYCWYFSEIYGMNVRYFQAGIKIIHINDFYGDISSKYKYLECIGMKGMWGFGWKDGKLIGYNNLNDQKDFLAIHIQKRKIDIHDIYPTDEFCVIPNEIINGCSYNPHIKRLSILYTVKRVAYMYSKFYRENHRLGEEARLIKEELYEYCTANGLYPPKSANVILRMLRKIKRKVIWE